MNPMMSFFKTFDEQEKELPANNPSEEQDISSLCCSSLSDDFSETSGQERQRKVRQRQYSRLAFSVSRMGKEDQDGETENYNDKSATPTEIDLTTTNHSRQRDETKKKVFDRKYSRLAFSIKLGTEMKK